MIKQLVFVASGGAIGASLRYLTGLLAVRWFGAGFPWGTLVVNIFGSFVMGIVVEYLARRLGAEQEWRLLLITGLLGGYTTFSAFSYEVIIMIERHAYTAAGSYIAANVIGAIVALSAGLILARHIF